MDKNNYKKFSDEMDKYREEVKREFNKISSADSSNLIIMMNLTLWFIQNLEKEKYSVSCEVEDGNPRLAIKASKFGLAFAIYQLLDYEDNFWQMLRLVMTVKEFMHFNTETEKVRYNNESKEQFDVLQALKKMSPEELKALKEKVENGPEES